MMNVRWLGEERMIPNVGVGTFGTVLSISTELAKNFIKQGLAEDVDKQPSLKPIKQGKKKEIE